MVCILTRDDLLIIGAGADLCLSEYEGDSPFLYSRWASPTVHTVAQHVAQLERG